MQLWLQINFMNIDKQFIMIFIIMWYFFYITYLKNPLLNKKNKNMKNKVLASSDRTSVLTQGLKE